MEPPEERMEQALFSPPLSKQRIEYALRLLVESHAKSLVLYLLTFGYKLGLECSF
jgi:hypothetical protein